MNEGRESFVKDEGGGGRQRQGSIVAGMAICWLLNIAQAGIGFLLLVADDRTLPAVFVLVGMIGLAQVGYVAPLWRLLRRKDRPRTARGLLLAAGITLLVNVVVWMAGPKLRFPGGSARFTVGVVRSVEERPFRAALRAIKPGAFSPGAEKHRGLNPL